jgi:hypothetical protein
MSSSIFEGDVTLPGEAGRGLSASVAFDAGEVTLTTESEVLGTWSKDEYEVQPTAAGEFRLTLGGEDLLFRPEAPAAFATAVLPAGTPFSVSENGDHEVREEPEPVGEWSDAGPIDMAVGAVADGSDTEGHDAGAAISELGSEPSEPASPDSAKPEPIVVSMPPIQSNLNQGLDDGIITAGFLRAIVVVSAALVTFAVIAIILV